MRTELVICDKDGNKTYTPAEFTFGNLRKLEQMGIDPLAIGNAPLAAISAYVALTVGCKLSEADEIIDTHIACGGDLNVFSEAMKEALEESDFFRGFSERRNRERRRAEIQFIHTND